MIISRIKAGCRVGFFGLGRSNLSLLSHLPLDKCTLMLRSDTAVDEKSLPHREKFERIITGDDARRDISEDIIFFSPSVRREGGSLSEAAAQGVAFTSDAELFFEQNRTPVFAVTGSDGKSTTATLVHLLLQEGGYKSRLIGNIGEPMWENCGYVCDFFVCELSSFMLKYCTPQSKRACITNITPNHLDWHSDLAEYAQCKRDIGRHTDRLIISDQVPGVRDAYGVISMNKSSDQLRQCYNAKIYMTVEDGSILKNGRKLIDLSKIRIPHIYNIKNLMMAIAMTDGMVGAEEIMRVGKDFCGLDHRCRLILSDDRVDYYDSSIDSTPARTVETLKSLNRQAVIILGGRGKGLDYGLLRSALKKYVKRAVICGENAEEIYTSVKDATLCEIFHDFNEAVLAGRSYAREVGVLLLSPASTSFDKFRNYAERGEKFKEILMQGSKDDNNCLQY